MFFVPQTVQLLLEKGHPPADSTRAPLTPQSTTRHAAGDRDRTKDREQTLEAREKPEYSFVTNGEATT